MEENIDQYKQRVAELQRSVDEINSEMIAIQSGMKEYEELQSMYDVGEKELSMLNNQISEMIASEGFKELKGTRDFILRCDITHAI